MPIEPDPRALPPGLSPAWQGGPRPRRGPKPSHTVEAVVAAAVELADTEGLAAASLPNIASALGLTTNALYRYVSSKDELLILLAETGFGPPPEPAAGLEWRSAVRAWADAAAKRYAARPWLLDVRESLTPHRLRWTEQLLDIFTGAGLSTVDALGCAELVSAVVRATADRRRTAADPDSPESAEYSAEVRAFLQPRLSEGGYPHLAELAESHGWPAAAPEDFALERVLDGIAALLP
ncbi:helix-turn-helix domain-containing protein [Amycolatopsis nivea]|uniref:helix-turn-helix domain-containing protein n=1 Tax=Amycolatopsis nivea TaxID=1644109 RepID=UPI00106F6C1F|nr:TetR/AcrR family transcriptional regulator [Amycolatopsis nivea]